MQRDNWSCFEVILKNYAEQLRILRAFRTDEYQHCPVLSGL